MEVKVGELEGAALDWAVHKAIDSTEHRINEYSTLWEFGGPLIENKKIEITPVDTGWVAVMCSGVMRESSILLPNGVTIERSKVMCYAASPLIAAMRAIVADKLGEEIDVPEELIK